MSLCRTTLVAAGLALAPLVAYSTTTRAVDEFYSQDPIQSATAIDRFLQCFPDTTADEIDSLKLVKYWGYRFSEHSGCPPDRPNCNPNMQWYQIQRTFRISHPEMAYSRMETIVASKNHSSCTSPREMGSVTRNVSTKMLEFRTTARERARVCPPWGGSWTAFEGRADLVFGYTIDNSFSMIPFSRVENESGEVFGFMSVDFAKALLVVFAPSAPILVGISLVSLADFENDMLDKLNFLGTGIDITGSLNNRPLEELGQGPLLTLRFKTNPSISGFKDAGDRADIEVIQHEYVGGATDLSNARLFVDTETQFLREINQEEPKTHVVIKGDSIWKITRKYLNDPRLHILVSSYNGLTNSKLQPGQVVNIPKWYELCQKLKPKSSFVRKGESLWSKSRAGEISSDLSQIVNISGRKDLIYPFEELKLKPVRHNNR